MTPVISVIMAAYNSEKYISESIQSILNQSFTNFELIIINDGSTDQTQQIIENFQKQDPRVLLINNPENLFVIKARNKGIKKAKGRYIAILDSDDLAMPDRLEKQVDYLENNPNIFLIGGSAAIIDENNVHVKDYIATTGIDKIKNNLFKENLIYHSTFMFRNDLTLYREKMLFCEDYDLILYLTAENKLIDCIPDILIKYRMTSVSLSRQDNKLIQWLFIHKAREFYHQKIKTGKDNYDIFAPERLVNITNSKYGIGEKDLILSMKFCFYQGDLSTLKTLLKKYKKTFPVSGICLFYSTISLNKSIFNISKKMFSKL